MKNHVNTTAQNDALHHTALHGFLFILHKAHRQLAGLETANARLARVITRADADAYIHELMPQLENERQKQRVHRKHHHSQRQRTGEHVNLKR